MTTVSWRVQNVVVINWVCFKIQRSKFWFNFEFDRNTVNGTGGMILFSFCGWTRSQDTGKFITNIILLASLLRHRSWKTRSQLCIFRQPSTLFSFCCALFWVGSGWIYLYPPALPLWHWGNHVIANTYTNFMVSACRRFDQLRYICVGVSIAQRGYMLLGMQQE